MTFQGVTHLTLDDEISAHLLNSSRLKPDTTHKLRTHPAFLPADNTPSLQLISVCGWYSLGTYNPVLSWSACKSIAALLFQHNVSFSATLHNKRQPCCAVTFRLTQYPESLKYQLSFQQIFLPLGLWHNLQ